MTKSPVKPTFIAPKGSLDRKPPHGQPCNRCGLCCMATLCPLGHHVFHRQIGPCPALEHDADGLSACGLVAHPAKYSVLAAIKYGSKVAGEAAALLIGAGVGCDARFNGETRSIYSRFREYDTRNKARLRRAKKLWGLIP